MVREVLGREGMGAEDKLAVRCSAVGWVGQSHLISSFCL